MKTALLIIDVQNDFCEGGSLAVKGSLEIIPVVNKLKELKFDNVVLTADWHNDDHISFNTSPHLGIDESKLDELTRKWKGAFPKHCVVDTDGAKFHKDLIIADTDVIFKKGTDSLRESFSGFGNPNLAEFLKTNNIAKVFVCGLAYDFCVGCTAIDASNLGCETYVVKDATRGISDQTTQQIELEFNKAKVTCLTFEEVVKMMSS